MNGFDFQPQLTGDRLRLRPLVAEDWDAVFAAASDPLIWALHPALERHKEDRFRLYFEDRLASRTTLVIIDRIDDIIIGWSSFGGFDPIVSEAEIGWTFLARSHWGGDVNRALKRLMLTHAFGFVDSVFFRIAPTNLRSCRATEKLGAVLTDRTDTITMNGVAIPHLIYAITKSDYQISSLCLEG